MAVTTERAKRAADEVADSPWTERLGRLGLTARGVVYCLIGLLAVQVATGHNHKVDKDGALETLARQPLGKVLLVALAAGFAGYAAWRVTKAAVGAGEGGKDRGRDPQGLAKRAGDVVAGLIYVSLFATAVRLVVKSSGASAGGGNQQEQSWTATLLEHSWGPWLVGIVGAGIIIGGAVLAWRGLGQRFRKHLRTSEMRRWQRRWLPALGTFGYTARGIVVVLVGAFLVRAAWQFDPHEAVGIDGALKRLAVATWGPWLLGLVALGLASFGVFSFVEARWRKVLDR